MTPALRALIPAPLLRIHRARSTVRHYAARDHDPALQTAIRLCRPDKTAIDIGANLGIFTHEMRRKSRLVHAFEPNPEMVQHLRGAFCLDRRVKIHDVALSDRSGVAELRIPVRDGERLKGLATISAGNSLAGMQTESVSVLMATLRSYAITDVGFIKIDVEGHELAVLQGALEMLALQRPDVLVEAAERHRPGAAASVIEFMSGLGYRGWFLLGDELVPVERFDVRVHQRSDGRDELGRPIGGVVSASNFVFSVKEDIALDSWEA